MTNETKNRIHAYMAELPHMKEKVFGALLMFVIAAVVVVSATYAWLTLSRSPEISEIATTLAANGALEIALSKPDGSMPDELDIDESVTMDSNVTISNLQWGNLVNLSDASYGIDNLALRPAQLNTTSLLTSPLWGAVYGGDGRITNLDSSYAYAKYNGSQFMTTNEYGVRAIATYKTEISNETQQAYDEKVQAVITAHTTVNQTYAQVAPKFSALGTMISKYAQNKLDDGYTDLAPYLEDVIPLVHAVRDAMETQMDAYVALANLQNYLYSNEAQLTYVPLTWENLYTNRTKYNTASADKTSTDGHISLVGLTQFVKDYEQLQKDIEHLELYYDDYKNNGASYYWGGSYVVNGETKKDNSASGYTLSHIVAHLIDYSTMTIDLNNDGNEVKVVSLGMDQAGALLSANGKERKVYAYNGILYRLEQSSIDQEYRIGGSASGKAACTINVKYVISITVKGQAYTKASGAATFMENFAYTQGRELVPSDQLAEDTYGLAIDLWVRTNAEETCLTLEGATSTDVQGNIVSYDGVNRIWGATGEAVLTTDSTTQGGGSCYVYYADTPEDMARSLDLLDSMKVAFVDAYGSLLATAEMDTAHPWAVNGRITVPLVLDNQSKTTYTYVDEQNAEHLGYAITTLYTDLPVRVTAIVYLDGTRLTNDDVLAAAEIQGSLNIQFGSSVNLKTVGSNELIDDTRTVTATVSPAKLDYDTATSNADMTTTVTVNIDGESVDPDTVTAFFVRAINSTQGSREKTMTFTKQDNGSWKCDYLFTAPGTYYLRQVRLDGVDYTLADPQKVEISGFGLSSVTWSESGNDVTVRTSEGTHSTRVTVQFSSDRPEKLPATVQARFVRGDGNTVNVPLTYSANGDWVGTGSFSASGVYQLQYLVADGRYIDLALLDGTYRTMDLSLGMYVTVDDLSGGLNEKYDKDAAEGVYYKDVAVRVYNNAGVALEDLDDPEVADDMRLYYANGDSISNTISTNLVWDDLEHCYIGTLPIVSPGRYQFAVVTVGSSYLTECSESPVYTVISPDPPIYDAASAVTVNDPNGIQFVPLTNNAKIDGIRIKDAEAASASAVVYSAETGEYYTVEMNYSGSTWSVNLPTYNGEQTGTDVEGKPVYEQIQEGRWSLAAIRLWGCYDENSEFRSESDPILWVAEGDVGEGYLGTATDEDGNALTADDRKDFSGLTTDVSGKVNVTMTAGTTALGSNTTPFGTVFQAAQTGMSVKLTDGMGRIIPKDNISVVLTLSHSGSDNTTYGYKVSGFSQEYTVTLNDQDAETGARTVSAASGSWIYAGEYKVNSLTVTIGGKTLTYSPGSIGVPAMYTVTTAAPTADDITLGSVKHVTTYGGTADNVTGTFLQAYNLDGTNVTIKLTGAGGQDMSYAVLEGLDVKLVLTHRSGTSQTYGGYTFTPGTTGYENLTLTMSEKTAGSGTYFAPGSQTLLAGIYTAQVQITAGGVTDPKDLDNITVRSVMPEVKITGVTPGTSETVVVNKNTDPATNHLTANADTFEAKNQYGDYYAVVYMGYEPYTAANNTGTYNSYTSTRFSGNYAHYTAPVVTVQASNYGSAEITLTAGGNSVILGGNAAELTVGNVNVGQYEHYEWYATSHDTEYFEDFIYKGDTATLLGTANIETVTSTVNNVTYTRTLANPLTISQLSQANPTLTWNAGAGTAITVKAGATTYTGTTDIPAMTQLTATVTADFGYHQPKLAEPAGAFNWTVVREDETEAVYTFQMAAGNTTLRSSATKYPAIAFSNANNANVAVTVGGTEITSNTGAKPGSTVVVTVTADKDNGFCKPRLAQPSGITWTANEGDFESTYTFNMPNQAVSLAAPTTTVMYRLSWTPHGALRFTVKDGNMELTNPSYVVPGHTLTIKLTATGGINPVLLSPADAGVVSLGGEEANYTYTMNGNVHLEATAESYPTVRVDTAYAAHAVESNLIDVTGQYAADGVSIKPGNTVKVILTAKDGYYAPRMTQPAGVTNWTVVSESNSTAAYTFTMPYEAVDARNGITASEAPTVSFTVSNATLSMTYTDYAGTEHKNVATGTKVQPGAAVTVTTTANTGYYSPTVSGVTGMSAVPGDWTSTYTFTMGTSNVTLSAAAAPMPTVTFNCSSYASLSMDYMGYNNASLTTTTGGVKVKPGSLVTVTGTIKDTDVGPVVNPTVTVDSGTVTGFAVKGTAAEKTVTYTFTMGSTDVTLKASGTPTLKWTKLDIKSGTPTVQYTLNGAEPSVTVDTATAIPAGAVVKIVVPGHYNNNGCETEQYAGVLANIYGFDDEKYSFKELVTEEGGAGPIFASKQPSAGSASNLQGEYYFTMPDNPVSFAAYHTNDSSYGCITEDTLITLADGSQVRVDTLTGNEQLLVWNHVTGQFDTAPIAYLIDHDGKRKETEVIHLYFSDGSDLEIVEEHVFYDADSGKYITLDENAVDYIGNGFAKQNLETGSMDVVTLTDVVFETKVTGVYEVVTYSYMTCFTDGILTASAYIENLLNIFDIDTATMAYDPVRMQQDIETYGLYTYEDLKHICTEEQFNMHNGSLVKVAVGKGTLTQEDMFHLVELFDMYARTSKSN